MPAQTDLAMIAEENKPLVRKIFNTVKHRIGYYADHVIFNGARVMDSDTVSIVMCTHKRIAQTLFGLRQIAKSAHTNLQVVLVDDSIDTFIEDQHLRAFPFRIDYIKINNSTRDWLNPCVNYNIGFAYAKGEYIMIQNPEVFHIGDVISHVRSNCCVDRYLVFNVIASRNYTSNDAIYALEAAGALTQGNLQSLFADHNNFKWYQHSIKRPRNLHFLTAIHRLNLEKLKQPFDYDFAMGLWYDDSEFIYRIQNLLHLNIFNIDDATTKLMGCHLHHDTVRINMGDAEYKKAIALNTFIFKNKVTQFERTQHWIYNYLSVKPHVSFATNPTFVFIQQKYSYAQANQRYYRKLAMSIHNIVSASGYKTGISDTDIYDNPGKMVTAFSPESIFVITALDFGSLYYRVGRGAYTFEHLNQIFKKINYVVIWQEVLDSDCSIVGYEKRPGSDEYTQQFFTNSKLNIVSNQISLAALSTFGIRHNFYSLLGGYSEVNGYIPFENTSRTKSTDVIIYGTLDETYLHRNSIIEELTKINRLNNNKYNIVVTDNISDGVLDDHLLDSKIVVHIPSYPRLVHMPWAKISYLFARKVFCIIEENDEMYTNPEFSHIPYFRHGDTQDLYNKIGDYIQHPLKREQVVDKNYEYIKTYSNLDTTISNAIGSL